MTSALSDPPSDLFSPPSGLKRYRADCTNSDTSDGHPWKVPASQPSVTYDYGSSFGYEVFCRLAADDQDEEEGEEEGDICLSLDSKDRQEREERQERVDRKEREQREDKDDKQESEEREGKVRKVSSASDAVIPPHNRKESLVLVPLATLTAASDEPKSRKVSSASKECSSLSTSTEGKDGKKEKEGKGGNDENEEETEGEEGGEVEDLNLGNITEEEGGYSDTDSDSDGYESDFSYFPPPSSPPSIVPPVSRTVQVLVVDDSLLQRKISRVLLSGKVGADTWMVNTADSGERALQVLESSVTLPDILVVDQNMASSGGQLLGHEVVKRIRENAAFSGMIIIGCTAYAEEAGKYFLEAGCDAVWTKPMPSKAEVYKQICELRLKKEQAKSVIVPSMERRKSSIRAMVPMGVIDANHLNEAPCGSVFLSGPMMV